MAFHHFKDMAPSARVASIAHIESAQRARTETDKHIHDSRRAIRRSLELLCLTGRRLRA